MVSARRSVRPLPAGQRAVSAKRIRKSPPRAGKAANFRMLKGAARNVTAEAASTRTPTQSSISPQRLP